MFLSMETKCKFDRVRFNKQHFGTHKRAKAYYSPEKTAKVDEPSSVEYIFTEWTSEPTPAESIFTEWTSEPTPAESIFTEWMLE